MALAPPPAQVARPAAAATLDVSVVVVSYNVRGFLEQTLDSVRRALQGLDGEVFVVDNDSVDGSPQMVQERFPEAHLIANEDNVGFAVANNQAIRQARGRYILLLNPDTVVQEDTLGTLVRFMDAHPEAGAVGCRILNPDGTFAPESRRAFPTPSVAFYRISGLSRLFPRSPRFGRYNLSYLPADQVCEVDALSGSCMMVRREALFGPEAGALETAVPGAGGDGAASLKTPAPQVGEALQGQPRAAGLLDEGFFMYGEDLDWCYRIQRAGWRIYYTPETQIVHYKGESTRKAEVRYVRRFYGAMLRFAEKHFRDGDASGASRVGAHLMCWAIRLGIVLRAFVSVLGRALGLARYPLRDFGLATVTLAAAAAAWSGLNGFDFGASFYLGVVPAYGLAAVAGVGLAGGYERHDRRRIRSALAGAGVALVGVAALSFFVQSLAFSRGAVLLGFAAVAVALAAVRWVERRRAGIRWTLLVGDAPEADRLADLLGRPGGSALRYAGFVGDTPAPDAPLWLGRARQLRDVVRLRGITDVVFAAEALSNTAILGHMRDLADLPVRFRILTPQHDRIIGKASVEDFSEGLWDTQGAITSVRSPRARRAADVVFAALALLGASLAAGLARLAPGRLPRLRRFAGTRPSLKRVLAGDRALVGYAPDHATQPPPRWGLEPAAFSVLDLLPERPDSIRATHRAYWFYAQNQSAWLDAELVVRALLRRP